MRNYVLGSAITVLDLKKMIWEKTHVQPQRQKLLNLKLKGKAVPSRFIQDSHVPLGWTWTWSLYFKWLGAMLKSWRAEMMR